ncbi:MAG: ABC transporter permease, partial [Firmicutes bacterium]|nr:ABC transporter permease [Candidatus Caballimonas caccae]
IFILIMFSFSSNKNIGIFSDFSLIWYSKLGEVSDIIINTVVLAVVSSIISTILGTLGAIGLFYLKGRKKRFLNGISQIPVVNSEIVTACALVMAFILIGVSNRSYFGLLVGHVILSAPFVLLSVTPKLKQMDGSLYEAALDLGATPRQALFKVILPEISAGIFTGFMLAITLSLDDYIVTATLSPLEFDTISTAVYKAIALTTETASEKVPIYRALTTIIFVLTLIIVLVININSKRKMARAKK